MNPFEQYKREIRAIKRDLKIEMGDRSRPHKRVLGEYIWSERDKGKRVQDIFEELGTRNTILMYECMEIADENR